MGLEQPGPTWNGLTPYEDLKDRADRIWGDAGENPLSYLEVFFEPISPWGLSYEDLRSVIPAACISRLSLVLQ